MQRLSLPYCISNNSPNSDRSHVPELSSCISILSLRGLDSFLSYSDGNMIASAQERAETTVLEADAESSQSDGGGDITTATSGDDNSAPEGDIDIDDAVLILTSSDNMCVHAESNGE